MSETRMFDFGTYYSNVAKMLPDNCRIAEIGVANGDSALYLVDELIMLGKQFKMYMIDSLQYGGTEQLNEIIKNVVKSGFAEYIEIVPVDSLNASCKYPDGFFDFVFIDASHEYELTKADIRCWYPKVKDEGILAGHDANAPDVNRAITEIIPATIVYDNSEDASQVLHIEDTTKGYGVWWLQKNWQLTRNHF